MKHRYLGLDGMRGIAALVVVTIHCWWNAVNFGPFGSGRLMVDFFFMLSGFVLAHAWEPRLARPHGALAFLRARVIRLQPLLLLGCLPLMLNLVEKMAIGRDTGPLPILTLLAAPIPFPAFWYVKQYPMMFPTNGPTWSLFWEWLMNIGFAFLAPRLSTRLLGCLVAAAAIGLTIDSAGQAGFGNFYVPDGVRALFGFSAGVLLYRLQPRLPRVSRSIAWLAPLLLIASSTVPYQVAWFMIYCPLVAILLYPVVVHFGAAWQPRFPRACALAGRLSYPVYITHWPVIKLAPQALAKFHIVLPDLLNGALLLALSLLTAWLAERFCDRPTRAWLQGRIPEPASRGAYA